VSPWPTAPRRGENDFAFDGAPERGSIPCATCPEPNEWSKGFILNHSKLFAVFFLWWHPHAEATWTDVILGSFEHPDFADNVTFAARHGRVPNCPGLAATLIDAHHEGAIAGHCLTREEALEHPRLDDNWAVTDWIYDNDELAQRAAARLGPNPGFPED